MMKAKYIFLIGAAAVATVSTTAKKGGSGDETNESVAAAMALSELIKTHPKVESDRLVEEVCNEYKKSAEVCRSAAESYWYNWQDTASVTKYVRRALTINPNHLGTHILCGDMYAYQKDTTKAVAAYEKAISGEPDNRRGYEAVAKMMRMNHPTEAEKAYDRAAKAIEGYPVNLEKARMYEILIPLAQNYKITSITAGEGMSKILPLYEEALKVEHDSVTASDYNNIAAWYYALGTTSKNIGNFKRGVEIAKEGIERYPDYLLTYHSALNNAFWGREYEFGAKCGEHLMESNDSTVNRLTYRLLAGCYFGRNQLTKAIDGFKKLLSRDDATEEDRSYAVGKIAEAYKNLGDYDKADNAYAEYIAQRKADGKLSFYDMWQYGEMYREKADELNGLEKIEALNKACDIYNEAAELDLSQAYMAQYRRYAVYTDELMDPGYKKGLAVDPAKKVASLLEAEGVDNLSAQKKSLLEGVYNFLGVYYFKVNENRALCKQYFEKLYNVNPNNETAITVLTKIFKMTL